MGLFKQLAGAGIAASFTFITATGAFAQTTTGGQSGTSGQSTTSGQTARADRQGDDLHKFIKKAAIGNLAEVELGRLGVEKAQDPEVKQFAQMMVDEHSKALDQLKQVASTSGVEVPSTLDEKHQKIQDKLSRLNAEEFDRQYMKAMVDAHQNMADLLEDRVEGDQARSIDPSTGASGTSGTTGTTGSTSGTSGTTGGTTGSTSSSASDPNAASVDAWASTALASVKSHLQQAKDLQDRVKKGGDSERR